MHIAVLGLGPAGAVLAHRAVTRGWTVDGYDPACREVDGTPTLPEWRSTYGIPLATLPHWARTLLPFVSISPGLSAHTPDHRHLGYGGYGVVDRTEARRRLAPGIRLHRRRVDAPTVGRLGVDAVVDCRGVVDRPGAVRQIAYGLFLPTPVAHNAGYTTAEFMDWRPSPWTAAVAPGPATPSFLYIQDVGDRVLVEETVLATRTPSRDMLPELRRRLLSRLGETAEHATGTEIVHFPLDRRRRPWYLGPDQDGVTTFGAAGGFTHPATGYSVAAAIAAADTVLDQLAAHVTGRPVPCRRRVSAALAWRLRLLGGELVVRAGAEVLPRFFDAFFRLPVRLQHGYLEGQDALAVTAAMVSLARFPADVLPFLLPLPKALYYTLKPR
ncbi:lycopene cyclase family protein [uncultured Corynebacterium sp.]|uniref:lycopene cyclase family protein n=1 Tax=uncultured Corynebacterium sp. TaxID=159447 RepID=UPI0025D9132C|nr:lycopene cyclase family protein [uncultured Corynebacterium sp.]